MQAGDMPGVRRELRYLDWHEGIKLAIAAGHTDAVREFVRPGLSRPQDAATVLRTAVRPLVLHQREKEPAAMAALRCLLEAGLPVDYACSKVSRYGLVQESNCAWPR